LTDILVRELSRPERPALEAHLLALGAQDRRLRFGAAFNEIRTGRREQSVAPAASEQPPLRRPGRHLEKAPGRI